MTDHTPEQAAYLDLLTRVQALEDAMRMLSKENQSLRRRVMELEIRERARQTVQHTAILDPKPVLSRLTGNPDRGRIAKS